MSLSGEVEPDGLRARLLQAHDEDLRADAELNGATDHARIGPLRLGRYGERGFVTYPDLAGAAGPELDGLIAAAIDHFAADARVDSFEWKTRGHDAPADLAEHLLRAGLVAEDAETVMIGEAGALAGTRELPAGVVLRRAGDTGDLAGDVRAVGRLRRLVFGPDSLNLDERLLAALTGTPEANELWLALAQGSIICSGRLARVPNTRFAGLFGGGTDPAWRGAGIYRALTAARAGSALAMGAELVYAECTEFSRPILARSGLLAVTTTTPYLWHRPRR